MITIERLSGCAERALIARLVPRCTPATLRARLFYPDGHALGHALFYGRGAGRTPTASAIVADLLGIALGTTGINFASLKIFPDITPPASVLPT